MLTTDGDVRFTYLGLYRTDSSASSRQGVPSALSHRAGDVAAERCDKSAPMSDVRSVATMVYLMCTGEPPPTRMNPDELATKVHDPLKSKLIAHSLLAATMPSADELVQLIVTLSPVEVADTAKMEHAMLLEVTKRVKSAAEECKQKFDEIFEELMPEGGDAMLARAASVASKYTDTPMQPFDEEISVGRLHEIALAMVPRDAECDACLR